MPLDQIGKYRIQGELGRGGFGTVYRAWDPEMRRSVAIKVINLDVGNDPAALARFRTEAATTANLHHKNIVTIYDSGEHNGQPWFAMEFIDGKTLRKALQDTPALELWEKVNILLQIAEGLQYAHDRGVVHRDIKPANVILPEGGGVKVLDFGIARLMDPELTHHATTTGLVQGTFGYLAPEQLDGGKGDRASDIFSYGVICYETLTGIQPFLASSLVQTVHRVANFDPAPLSRFVPDCPPRLQEIVHKAIAKDPARRYRSLRELILDLAPVEVSLRAGRATELAREAEAMLEKGDRDGAQACLDRALMLDRLNEKGQALRRQLSDRDVVDVPVARPRARRVRYLLALIAIGFAATGLLYIRTRPESPSPAPPAPIAADNPPVVQPAPVPAPSPSDTIEKEIRDGDWDDAALRLKQFEKLNPGDSRIKDWRNQIGKGIARERKLADLRSSADKAIKSGNWGKADSEIRKLLTQAPGDAVALKARQSVVEGLKQDQRVKSLRAFIKSDLHAKRWTDAKRDITELLSLVPGDPEATRWKAQLAKGRGTIRMPNGIPAPNALPLEPPPNADPEVVAMVDRYFPYQPVLKAVAQKESNFNQWEIVNGKRNVGHPLHTKNADGTPGTATGVMQIKSDLSGFCADHQMDINTIEGNLQCSLLILDRDGIDAWAPADNNLKRTIEFDMVVTEKEWAPPFRVPRGKRGASLRIDSNAPIEGRRDGVGLFTVGPNDKGNQKNVGMAMNTLEFRMLDKPAKVHVILTYR